MSEETREEKGLRLKFVQAQAEDDQVLAAAVEWFLTLKKKDPRALMRANDMLYDLWLQQEDDGTERDPFLRLVARLAWLGWSVLTQKAFEEDRQRKGLPT